MVERQKNVIASLYYYEHLTEIIEYGGETFGYGQAEKYLNIILHFAERLSDHYTAYPECRYLATKSRMYRNTFSMRI